MKPRILLVNPPIYDFTAYDFWLKPYGLLRVGGRLRSAANLSLFDYLDRRHPAFDPHNRIRTDCWGRGPFPGARIPKPPCLQDIPRYFRRFGIDRNVFQRYLSENGPFEAVLIQTVMTYWYPGVKEVIEDVRRLLPGSKIILGGFYATACSEHARSLGVDAVIRGDEMTPLQSLGLHVSDGLPAWDLYASLKTGILTLTRGCPFQCSYCYIPQSGVGFAVRPLEACLTEIEQLVSMGVRNIAFYDDALLVQPEKVLIPFLEAVIRKKLSIHFHTPNALHARFVTAEIAHLMVQAGFKTFYLGFESRSEIFHQQTGSGKVVSQELAQAVACLTTAGVDPSNLTAYEMLGHPRADIQHLESSMHFVNSLGIRLVLSDFSPIPGTPDGDLCRSRVDLDEPLNHNKTAFPIRFLGFEQVNYYKQLCKNLNRDSFRQQKAL